MAKVRFIDTLVIFYSIVLAVSSLNINFAGRIEKTLNQL